jgi:YYY domain-containing protein
VGIPGGLTDTTGFFTRLGGAFTGMWQVMIGGQSLPYSLHQWYWIPSRVIPAPNDVEPITEFPLFTFLYADLHAHMLALPITLLALTWALAVLMGRGKWQSPAAVVSGFLLGGLAIGALRPTNTWDIFVYLALGVLAIIYTWWRYLDVGPGTFKNTLLESLPTLGKRLILVGGGVIALVALAVLLYYPYAQWYALGYNKIDLWKGTHTPTSSYLVHWGVFLFVIVSWMIYETRQWMACTPLSSLRKLERYQGLIFGGAILLLGWIGLMLVMKAYIAWLVLPLAAWAGVLLLRPGLPDRKRGVLFMIGTGLILTLMVEVTVLHGDIGRMNWVFKFYLQVWTLFSISAAAAFGWLLAVLFSWKPSGSYRFWQRAWQVAFTLLVASAALFTVYGTIAKVRDRMTYYEQYRLNSNVQAPHTLDGMQYMRYASYYESGPNDTQGVNMDLSQDYDAIRWMQENVQGSPVIVEAVSRNNYRWYNRYTIYTGLPDVVGWEWHQQQQRALNPSEWVTSRIFEIAEFYNTIETDYVTSFLRKYDVEYIIVGQLEQVAYPGPGLQKFADFNGVLWREVYRNAGTVIYQVIK